jgi:hypothetical protein
MTRTGRTFVCSICGAEGRGWDNNAWPINMGRCCHDCNFGRVLPARIELMRKDEVNAALVGKESHDD